MFEFTKYMVHWGPLSFPAYNPMVGLVYFGVEGFGYEFEVVFTAKNPFPSLDVAEYDAFSV